jgi:hypothetical protein
MVPAHHLRAVRSDDFLDLPIRSMATAGQETQVQGHQKLAMLRRLGAQALS